MRKVAGSFIGLVAVALSVCSAGCGGGGTAADTHPQASAEPTREFVIPGGDNTVQYFGHEAVRAQREQVSTVVEAWDRARAAEKWKLDCSYLTRAYIDNMVTDAESVSKGKATSCVEALAFFGVVASGTEDMTTTGPIDSLRVSGRKGYVQYHGRNGQDWIVPVEEEGGMWKVGVSAPIERQGGAG